MRYLRMTLIGLAIGGCGLAVYLAYDHLHSIEMNQLHTEDLIPDDALLVYQSDNIIDDWNRVSSTSIFWENIRSNDLLSEFISDGTILDSIITANEALEGVMNGHTTTISMHYDNQHATYLYMLELGPDEKPNAVLEMIDRAFPPSWEKSDAKVEEANFSLYSQGDYKLYIGAYRNLIVACHSEEMLVKVLLLDPEKPANGLSNMIRASGHGFDIHGNLFINFRKLNLYAKNNLKSSPLNLMRLNGWASMDITIKPKSFLLNGVLERENRGLTSQIGSLPNVPLEIHRMIPSNIGGLIRYTIPEKGLLNSELCLQDSTSLFDHILEVNERFKVDIGYHLLSWLGSEGAVVFDDRGNKIITLLVSPAETDIQDKLIDYSRKMAEVYELGTDSSGFHDYTILKSRIPFGYNQILGEAFEISEEVWIAVSEKAVHISESKEILLGYIQDADNETLGENITFNLHLSDHLSASSAFLLYFKPYVARAVLKDIITDKHFATLEEKKSFFEHINFIGCQIVASAGNLPVNIVGYYDQSEKRSSKDLWETELAGNLTGTPFIIYNHRSKSRNILVQDDRNTVYLLTNTGTVQWKKQMDGQLQGVVEQIDIFANGKLQIVCNTPKSLYVIDILGRDVEGFPKKLKSRATGKIAVFDYEKNNDYRILVPCGKQIYNYDKKGQAVDGWEFNRSKDTLRGTISHAVITGKDIIFTYDQSGNLYYLNRRGEERNLAEENLIREAKRFRNNNLYFEKSNSVVTSKIIYLDTLGNIISTYLGGNRDSLTVIGSSRRKTLYYADVDDDRSGDYIVRDNNQILVYSRNKELIFSFKNNLTSSVFLSTKNGTYIGLYNQQDNILKIIDKNGTEIRQSGMSSSGGFIVDDINRDGIVDVIYGTPDRQVKAYSIK